MATNQEALKYKVSGLILCVDGIMVCSLPIAAQYPIFFMAGASLPVIGIFLILAGANKDDGFEQQASRGEPANTYFLERIIAPLIVGVTIMLVGYYLNGEVTWGGGGIALVGVVVTIVFGGNA